jgi:hypothetical protein
MTEPAPVDMARSRIVRADAVRTGDLIVGAAFNGQVDMLDEPYPAEVRTEPGCGCDTCRLVPEPRVLLSDGFPYDAHDPWPVGDMVLIVPAVDDRTEIALPGTFARHLEPCQFMSGADDRDAGSRELRLAFESARTVRRGHSHAVAINASPAALDMLAEYAETPLETAARADWSRTELAGARLVLKRIAAARATH